MPDISASIEYLADLPIYQTEKPYGALLANGTEFFAKGKRLDNIFFEEHECIVSDVRDKPEFTLERCGFQICEQVSNTLSDFQTKEEADIHKKEIAESLKKKFDAVHVNTYDLRTRINLEPTRTKVDVLNPLLVEPRARGAHNGTTSGLIKSTQVVTTDLKTLDVTLKSGPEIVYRHSSEGELEQYLKPGYRIRIIKYVLSMVIIRTCSENRSTWRPLLPVCEDRPLAFCDASSIDPKDLIPADRVYPHSVGEIYYLGYNKNHRW